MNDLDTEARVTAGLHDAVPYPPRVIDPAGILAAHPPRRRRMVASLASAVAVVAVVALVVTLTGSPARAPRVATSGHRNVPVSSASSQPMHSYPFTRAERRVALRVARSEAFGATRGRPQRDGWPTAVDRVTATVLRDDDAQRYEEGDTSNADAHLVLVVEVVGRDLRPDVSVPPAALAGRHTALPTSNQIIVLADRRTGAVTDRGIEMRRPPYDLPGATVLFQR